MAPESTVFNSGLLSQNGTFVVSEYRLRGGYMVPRDVRVQLNEQLVELANSYYQHYGSKHDALSALGEDLLRLADQGVHDGSSSWIALIQELCRRSG